MRRSLNTGMLTSLFLLYCVTFLIVLPIVCHNLRHSIYFSSWSNQEDGVKELKKENEQRKVEAKEYLRTRREFHQPLGRDVVVGIITHSRARHFKDGYQPGYLTQTAAKALQLTEETSLKPLLFVCNVDSDPKFHTEASNLSSFVPVVNRFRKLSLPMVHPKEKEKQDYQFCLNHSLTYQAENVFLIEDDAFPHDDTMKVLEHVLRSHIARGSAKANSDHYTSTPSRTSYIKFYHPERLLGFLSGSVERIPELLALSTFLSTLTLLSVSVVKPIVKSSTMVTCILWLILTIYFVLIALSLGRTNILELRRSFSPHLYSLTPAPSCCTQAILYPQESARKLVKYMGLKTCDNNYAKDHVIEDFTKSEKIKNGLFQAYLVQPSTFTHIGLYSALRNQIVDPFLL